MEDSSGNEPYFFNDSDDSEMEFTPWGRKDDSTSFRFNSLKRKEYLKNRERIVKLGFVGFGVCLCCCFCLVFVCSFFLAISIVFHTTNYVKCTTGNNMMHEIIYLDSSIESLTIQHIGSFQINRNSSFRAIEINSFGKTVPNYSKYKQTIEKEGKDSLEVIQNGIGKYYSNVFYNQICSGMNIILHLPENNDQLNLELLSRNYGEYFIMKNTQFHSLNVFSSKGKIEIENIRSNVDIKMQIESPYSEGNSIFNLSSSNGGIMMNLEGDLDVTEVRAKESIAISTKGSKRTFFEILQTPKNVSLRSNEKASNVFYSVHSSGFVIESLKNSYTYIGNSRFENMLYLENIEGCALGLNGISTNRVHLKAEKSAIEINNVGGIQNIETNNGDFFLESNQIIV